MPQIFLGNRGDSGLSMLLPPDYFCGTRRGQTGGTDPELDNCRHMRLVLNNEVPRHTFFQHDKIKGIVEYRGTGLTSRTIYKTPEVWQPCCGVQCLSNHPCILNQAQANDTGVKRRFGILHMLHEFGEESLKDVKAEIQWGDLNRELFYVTRILHKYILQLPPGLTKVDPRPPRLEKETQEAFERGTDDQLKAWIESHTEPSHSCARGTPATVILPKLAEELDMVYLPHCDNKELMDRLALSGVHSRRSGKVRVLTYQYPDNRNDTAIRLVEEF